MGDNIEDNPWAKELVRKTFREVVERVDAEGLERILTQFPFLREELERIEEERANEVMRLERMWVLESTKGA